MVMWPLDPNTKIHYCGENGLNDSLSCAGLFRDATDSIKASSLLAVSNPSNQHLLY